MISTLLTDVFFVLVGLLAIVVAVAVLIGAVMVLPWWVWVTAAIVFVGLRM